MNYYGAAPSGAMSPIIQQAKVTKPAVVVMPHAVAVVLFRVHLLTTLIKDGNSPNEALAKIDAYPPEELTRLVTEMQKEIRT